MSRRPRPLPAVAAGALALAALTGGVAAAVAGGPSVTVRPGTAPAAAPAYGVVLPQVCVGSGDSRTGQSDLVCLS